MAADDLGLLSARFATSAATLEQCPSDSLGEVVFLGRSNSGKSSSINAVCGQRALARTSRTPGRTQLLNYFDLGASLYLVDSPGFGYARVSQAQVRIWRRELERYLRNRAQLRAVVLVSDIRQAPAPFDANCLQWARQIQLPCLWLLNKSDKLKQGERARKLRELASAYPETHRVIFSALRGQGLEAARLDLGALLA